LRVGAGSQKLARTEYSYNVPSWKPIIRYSSTAGRGDLIVEQPNTNVKRLGNIRYEWDVRLHRDVPVDLRVKMGAGEAELDVGGLSLKGIDIDMGVGQLNLDLRGAPQRNYDVRIRGGVGEATVLLPRDVGVSAEAEGGIGEIEVRGLHREGKRYVNDAYERAKVRVHLDIHGGIGSIRLIGD
jgi:predicted membrane protein